LIYYASSSYGPGSGETIGATNYRLSNAPMLVCQIDLVEWASFESVDGRGHVAVRAAGFAPRVRSLMMIAMTGTGPGAPTREI